MKNVSLHGPCYSIPYFRSGPNKPLKTSKQLIWLACFPAIEELKVKEMKKQPNLFVAVQCCNCSTMQVKQKTNNNRWVCVICNQKQSIRKVFAQGNAAKEIRKVVQSVNMARNITDRDQDWDAPSMSQAKKQRVDWSRYLDPLEVEKTPGDDTKQHVLGRSITSSISVPGPESGDDNKLYKPMFQKKILHPDLIETGKEKIKMDATKVTRASKWDEYLVDDDEIRLNHEAEPPESTVNILDGFVTDHKVEDYVHPDFMGCGGM